MGSKFNYKQLDPGIRDTVKFFRMMGFNTVDSGDGVSKPEVGRAFDIPHVVIECSKEIVIPSVERIVRALRQLKIELMKTKDGVEVEGRILASSKTGIVVVTGLNDDILNKAKTTPVDDAEKREWNLRGR